MKDKRLILAIIIFILCISLFGISSAMFTYNRTGINSKLIVGDIYMHFIMNKKCNLWGLGIGDWGLGPIPNPQSPIPNPQSPLYI